MIRMKMAGWKKTLLILMMVNRLKCKLYAINNTNRSINCI